GLGSIVPRRGGVAERDGPFDPAGLRAERVRHGRAPPARLPAPHRGLVAHVAVNAGTRIEDVRADTARIAAVDGAGGPVVRARTAGWIEAASRRAAVAVGRVAVVAGLGAAHPAVATDGGADRRGSRAGPAILHVAGGAAAIPLGRVAVVTDL